MERIPIPYRLTALVAVSGDRATSWGINHPFGRLYPGMGQVGYVLLTRAPVAINRIATVMMPHDLHVLSL